MSTKRNLTSQPKKLEKIEGNVEFESEPRDNDDREIDKANCRDKLFGIHSEKI
jgi:hypothetical protein